MKGLIAVIGPTAVGKSKLALQLCQKYNYEIVNADSRQIYRYMDIGTAKPPQSDLDIVPHHLIDIIDPDEAFSLTTYQRLAYEKISCIQSQGGIPILTGGSGLYAWAVMEGWTIPEVSPDNEFRHNLEKIADINGIDVLYQELRSIDPVTANKIVPNNLRRIIRALEIYKMTGIPASQLQGKKSPQFPKLVIGLTANRDYLYRIIDHRIDEMLENGLVNEVENLLKRNYTLDLPSMSGIGYRQIGMVINRKINLPEAVQQIKYGTHKFARHQYAWFRLNDTRIHWFDICDNIQTDIDSLVSIFINTVSSNKEDEYVFY